MTRCQRWVWAIEFSSKNQLDGVRSHFGFHRIELSHNKSYFGPLMFLTKAATNAYIKKHFAYYKRKDLRAEPHGWRMPKAVRVCITVETVST